MGLSYLYPRQLQQTSDKKTPSLCDWAMRERAFVWNAETTFRHQQQTRRQGAQRKTGIHCGFLQTGALCAGERSARCAGGCSRPNKGRDTLPELAHTWKRLSAENQNLADPGIGFDVAGLQRYTRDAAFLGLKAKHVMNKSKARCLDATRGVYESFVITSGSPPQTQTGGSPGHSLWES